jgi:predicted nucleic acid-binding protein
MADSHVLAWSRSIDVADTYISVITAQELEYGVLRIERRDTAQGLVLRAWATDTLKRFDGRILNIDLPVALRCAQLHIPNPRQYQDALIAATAFVHNLTLVTRNIQDFEGTGIKIINPWFPQ